MYPRYFDFLFQPAVREIFINFKGIYGRDENGKAVKISLTQDKAVAEYCNKIKVGETVKMAIMRSLKTDFGLDLIDYDLWVFGIDTAKNKREEILSQIPVVAYVKFVPLKSEKVVGCDAKWISREDETLNWIRSGSNFGRLNNILNEEELATLTNKFYELGAIDVYIDTLEEPDDVIQNIGLAIRLPGNNDLRKNIFTLCDEVRKKKSIGTNLETDVGQKNIILWFG
ncbi:MAG TPA: hypothetical protein PK639_04540 [Candidatus Woesebacteria bacterium]|nr:hypothetical protein [Candidatus Woesebacteria bacterium]